MKIKFKQLNPNAIVPQKGTMGSAGADLFACVDSEIYINPNQRLLVPTGLMLEIPEGFGGFVFPRSSIASKYGVSLSNCVGVIDSDYRGELKIAVINHSEDIFIVRNGDRIAQLVILAVPETEYELSDDLTDTVRGEGGFGSTGR